MTANRIIQHIFQQPDIKEVDESAIDRLVSAHPYFTAARLLLARKQYSTQRNLLAPGVKKAQQYSTNMHYFFRFVTTEEKSLAEAVVAPAPVPVQQEEDIIAFPGQNEHTAAAETVTPETSSDITQQEETPVLNIASPAPPSEQEVKPAPVEIPASVTIVPAMQQAAGPAIITPAPAETQTADQQAAPAEAAPAPAPVQASTPEPAAQVPASNGVQAADTDNDPIKIFPLEIPEAENTLTYQPLYTDDYFAYKRLKEPEKAEYMSEKGAAEMKSFTSWLKDMKKSFADRAGRDWYHQQLHRSYEDFDPEVSETVEKMAMESITLNDDIVSETLAEIWARQHQYQTAIHIYQKLSLLNPNKSAYFAQKIKELQLLTEKN